MCKGNIVKTDTHTQIHDYIPSKNTTASSTGVGKVNVNVSTKNGLKKLGERTLVERFDIKFQVKIEMVPSCRVMVYYVRKDKEVVADSAELDVENKLENQVYTRKKSQTSKVCPFCFSQFINKLGTSDFVGIIRFVTSFVDKSDKVMTCNNETI